MKYITSWKLPPSLIDAAIKKFLETGGAPPEAVKMLGRWHGMNGTGVAISESDDPKAMYQRYAQWANVMEVAVTLVMKTQKPAQYPPQWPSAG